MIQASGNMAQLESHEFELHQQTLGLIFDYYHYYIPVAVFEFFPTTFILGLLDKSNTIHRKNMKI